jgi:hypothetical protein
MDGLMRPTGKLGLEMGGKNQPLLTTKDTKSHEGKPGMKTFVDSRVLCGLCSCYLFAHSYPGLQIARGTEQADAGAFQFEIRVLKGVVTLVGLIADIVQVMQGCAA